ncbi:hypothetical protein ACFYOF_16980 [Streptomyces sp. NPDC007148]|uniref:hypothetical protein n=1 Tax=Streptomyces sp. NPDC007148 TaxID=3364775 RepID=UPI0036B61EA7
MKPSVGRTVHYVSYGTPGGEYASECRAAIITELSGDPDHPNQVGLAVFNPTGMFFNRAVQYDDGAEQLGTPDCPNTISHGDPFRYCTCGWREAAYAGGTWHWPERVAE